MKRTIIILYILLLCLPLNAIQDTHSFIPLSLSEGLTHSRVQCIFRDHSGVLWIGTKNGLNSWDQSELKSFLHDPSNLKSIPNNYIKFIVEGSDNKLYISTNNGICAFIPTQNECNQILYEGKTFDAWSCLRTDSVLLFGGRKTIYSYSYKNKSIHPLVDEIKGDMNKCVNHISIWDSHSYIASTQHDGVWIFDIEKKTMTRCPFVKERNITNIFVDSNGCLYVSIYGKGVIRYKHDGTFDKHFSTKNGTLTNDVVLDFVEKDNIIWMGTDGGGINLLNLQTDKVTSIKHIPNDLHSLPNNSIYCLYKDDKGNIFGGSIHSGLFLAIGNYIKTYKNTQYSQPEGLSELTVTALHEDADTLLWIGTDGGGLNTYHQYTGKFQHFSSTNEKKIVSIASFSSKELIISCFNDGLYLFDKRTAQLTPFPLMDNSTSKEEFSKGDLINLYVSSDEIYIFAFNIYVYNLHTKRFTVLSVPQHIKREQFMNAQPVYADNKYIYILSYKNLLRIGKANKNIQSLFSVSDNESLTSACVDCQGDFWIGSDYSLYSYNPQSNQTKKIQNAFFHNIQSLTSDNKNRIWIGLNNMLLSYNISEKRIVMLDETDGVKPNGYIFTPMPMSVSNNIYIGGTQGLTIINKDIEMSDKFPPTVNLLNVSLDGRDITNKVTHDKKLVVPYKHSSINFKVIVDEDIPFHKHLFNYTLEGDTPRKIQSYSRKIELGILRPGDYTLLANCSSNENWSKTSTLLYIHVEGPIWQRSWFITLCVILFISICIGVIRLMQKQMNRKLKLAIAKNKREQEDQLRFITRLNDIIDNNIDKPDLDNLFLQKEMSMGRTSLYNKLKQTTGMGTSEYINLRRIKKAEDLLLNTNLSVSEISDRLGFTYQRYFSTIFKKVKGVSPSQFRNNNGENN